VLVAQPRHGLLDLVLVGLRDLRLDLDRAHVGQLELGVEVGVDLEREVLALDRGVAVEVGMHRHQLELTHRLGVVLVDQRLAYLARERLGADAPREHAARRLAGTEPGHPHFARETGEDAVERPVDHVGGDGDLEGGGDRLLVDEFGAHECLSRAAARGMIAARGRAERGRGRVRVKVAGRVGARSGT
jgi:hypothetical protein